MQALVKTPICEDPPLSLCKTMVAHLWILPSFHSISGVNFVATEFQRTKTPSVASLSLGGGVSNALDSAIVRVSPVNCIKPFARPNPSSLF